MIFRKNTEKTDYFSQKMYRKLFVPTLLSSIGYIFADVADSIVVGLKAGPTGLAAIGLTMPLFMLSSMFVCWLTTGGCVIFSNLLAKYDEKKATGSFQAVFCIALIIGLLFALPGNLLVAPLITLLGVSRGDAALYTMTMTYMRLVLISMPFFFVSQILYSYLQNDSRQYLATTGYTAGNICDIALNFILVYFLNIGIRGAAIATIIGQLVALTIFTAGLLKRPEHLKLFPFCPEFSHAKEIVLIGGSSATNNFYDFLSTIFLNHILIGGIGSIGVAVFQLVQSVISATADLYDGIIQTVRPLASTYYGERNTQAQHTILKLGIRSGCIAGSLFSLLLILFPQYFCALFGLSDAETLPFAVTALRLFSSYALIASINKILEGYFQSTGREKYTFFLMSLRNLIIFLPVILLFLHSIHWIWLIFPLTELISLGIFGILCHFTGNGISREQADSPCFNYELTCKIESMDAFLQTGAAFCSSLDVSVRQQNHIMLAGEELAAFVLDQYQGNRERRVHITITQEGNDLVLYMRDNYDNFNPFDLRAGQVTLKNYADQLNTIGIYLVKNMVSSYSYRQYLTFNTICVRAEA